MVFALVLLPSAAQRRKKTFCFGIDKFPMNNHDPLIDFGAKICQIQLNKSLKLDLDNTLQAGARSTLEKESSWFDISSCWFDVDYKRWCKKSQFLEPWIHRYCSWMSWWNLLILRKTLIFWNTESTDTVPGCHDETVHFWSKTVKTNTSRQKHKR